MAAALNTSMTGARPLWWGFVPYIAASLVHVGARFAGNDALAAPSKLTLMPALALAIVWAGMRLGSRAALGLLLAGIFLSWLGDGAGTFFPGLPTLPMMLLCFGLAHLCYMRLFWSHLSVRKVPPWALVYAAWWLTLVIVMWPRAGGLALAVTLYGVVLGGTAVLSTRCHPLIVAGGALFLASDTILAFRIFALELMPDWTNGMVMLTYTGGQGLIAAGALLVLRRRAVVPKAPARPSSPEAAGQGS